MLQSPARTYLDSLSGGYAKEAGRCLNIVADHASGGRADASQFRWEKLERRNIEAIERWLSEQRSPATARRIFTTVRRVLSTCFEMDLMSGEEYERALGLARGSSNSLSAVKRLYAQEIETVLELCAQGRLDVTRSRDAALVSLVLGYGLGEGGASSLDLSDYYALASERTVAAEVVSAIESWILLRGESRGPLLHPIKYDGTILRQRMSKDSVYDALKRLGRRVTPDSPPASARSHRKAVPSAPKGGTQPCHRCGGFVWGCLRCGQAERLPGRDVAKRKAERSVQHVASRGRNLTREEFSALLSSCVWDASLEGARDAAVIAILCAGNLTRSEVVDLDLTHWNPDPPTLFVEARPSRPSRKVLLDNVTTSLMKRWLTVRGPRPGPIFLNSTTGKRIRAKRVTAMLQRRSWNAGIDAVSIDDLHKTVLQTLLAGRTAGTLARRYGRGVPSLLPEMTGRAVATAPEVERDPRLDWIDALDTSELETLAARIHSLLFEREKAASRVAQGDV